MLKMVPVCGGGSVLNVAGSCCGRAGRRLRLMIFFLLTFSTFPSPAVATSVASFVVVRVPSAAAVCERSSKPTAGAVSFASTSAISASCMMTGKRRWVFAVPSRTVNAVAGACDFLSATQNQERRFLAEDGMTGPKTPPLRPHKSRPFTVCYLLPHQNTLLLIWTSVGLLVAELSDCITTTQSNKMRPVSSRDYTVTGDGKLTYHIS